MNDKFDDFDEYKDESTQDGTPAEGATDEQDTTSHPDPYSDPQAYAESHSSVDNEYSSQSYQTPYSAQSAQQTNPYGSYAGYSTQSNSTQQYYTPSEFNEPPKKNKKRGKRIAAVVTVFCVVLAAAAGVTYALSQNLIVLNTGTTTDSDTTSSAAVQNGTTVNVSSDTSDITTGVTEVVENAMPSMVAITAMETTSMNDLYGYYGYYFYGYDTDSTYETTSSGSGIIVAQDDDYVYIVTNYHVIEDADELSVEFIDESTYSATIKGTSEDNDLAVLMVSISDIASETLNEIKVATLGDSTTLKLGEPAIAIGNSLGYGQSVTVGYISALEREVQIEDNTMTLLQTDAAINPGNSGGALLNIKGEVIGINSAKYSDTSVEGTGYAIPISDAEPVINSLINSTYVSDDEKPYLGIYGTEVPTAYQSSLGWPAGVYVSQVTSGSPAALAGLQAGDIITAVDGTEITTMEELQAIIEECSVGDSIEITVTRIDNSGTMKQGTLTATLIARGDADESDSALE